jgi:hypothetical protein
MPIPNADSAYVPSEKLSDYLLNEQHPVAGSKAKWFRSLGYDPANQSILQDDLLTLVQNSTDFTEKSTGYGTKYVVSGKIATPSGDEANVTTVWIIEPSDSRPRLVTAFPGDKR